MPWGRRRHAEDRGPASYGYEDPDWLHAANAYGAAVQGMEPEDRPPLVPDEWADGGHAAWACDDPHGCPEHGSGGSGYDAIDVPAPWAPQPAAALPGHRSDHCLTMDPYCRGECGG